MHQPMRICYDAEGDMLEIFFGPPRPSIGTTLEDGVTVFISEEDNSVVGIMLMGAAVRTGISKGFLVTPLDVDVRLNVDLPEPEEDILERLAAENPELIAKCEAMLREQERVVAVAEERAEYKASGEE